MPDAVPKVRLLGAGPFALSLRQSVLPAKIERRAAGGRFIDFGSVGMTSVYPLQPGIMKMVGSLTYATN